MLHDTFLHAMVLYLPKKFIYEFRSTNNGQNEGSHEIKR
jgi:hypothetical protein